MTQVLLTPTQVAEQLQLEERTITHWLRTRRLRGYKIGKEWRIAESDLSSFLESHANVEVPLDEQG